MAFRAGQEVDAFCGRCKLDLLHRIVAVANDKPVNVECRTCYQVHRYRPPHAGPGYTSVGSPPSRAASPRRVSSREEAAPSVPPATARVHAYTMAQRYAADDWIVHAKFGHGRILREIGSDKIEVSFDVGLKTLIHNRPE